MENPAKTRQFKSASIYTLFGVLQRRLNGHSENNKAHGPTRVFQS